MRIGLLGGFDCLIDGQPVSLPMGAQRLIALLAISVSPVNRTVAAEQLWPDSYSSRSAANLRSALWSAKKEAGAIIRQSHARLALEPDVSVDLREALRKIDGTMLQAGPDRRAALSDNAAVVGLLERTLLPGWTEDWLEYERLRWDQLRVHALEQIAVDLLAQRRYVDALRAVILAVSIDPIRESGHRILIEIHLAEGNAASALNHGEQYRRMLHRELGTTPSPQLDRLIGRLTSR